MTIPLIYLCNMHKNKENVWKIFGILRSTKVCIILVKAKIEGESIMTFITDQRETCVILHVKEYDDEIKVDNNGTIWRHPVEMHPF